MDLESSCKMAGEAVMQAAEIPQIKGWISYLQENLQDMPKIKEMSDEIKNIKSFVSLIKEDQVIRSRHEVPGYNLKRGHDDIEGE